MVRESGNLISATNPEPPLPPLPYEKLELPMLSLVAPPPPPPPPVLAVPLPF